MSGLSRRNFAKALASMMLIPLAAPLMSRKAFAAGETIKVALLLPGSVADGGWSQLAYQGLQNLKAQGFSVASSESVPQAQMEQVIRGYADDGYNLIIGHSFEYGSAFNEIAPEYPDSQWRWCRDRGLSASIFASAGLARAPEYTSAARRAGRIQYQKA